MKECDNCKIHTSSNFILSVCLLIMLDNLFLRPSLHCNTSLHFTTLHPTTLHYTYRHFNSSHLHFTTLSFGLTHLHLTRVVQTYCKLTSEPINKDLNSNTVATDVMTMTGKSSEFYPLRLIGGFL
jgi:hypothetical protein